MSDVRNESGSNMSFAATVLRALVRLYQLTFSWLAAGSCRHAPSCSAYALEALERHGAVHGGWLALRRLARCHPWGSSGYDPVPGELRADGVRRLDLSGTGGA